jgi:putative endonuclease
VQGRRNRPDHDGRADAGVRGSAPARQRGGAVYSVTPAKQQRLLRAAQYYLLRHKIPPPCRFDLVAIDDEKLSWIQNVLEM